MKYQFREPQEAPDLLDVSGKFYVASSVDNKEMYLHTDGGVRDSTYCAAVGEYLGYFVTKEEAQEALDKYNKRLS